MKKGNVLLIAGGGTLGGYAQLELLKMGRCVDVIALEDYHPLNVNLRYIQAEVTDELLKKLFAEKHYDAIVDFIHYTDPAAYEQRGRLLLENTDQLVYLSSYRVYADEEHPIRESSPQLLDTSKDEYFLSHEDYAIPKSRIERFLRGSGYKNWTIVRPLISFSHFRLDLVTLGAPTLLGRSAMGKKIILPEETRDAIAGVGWAGNVGRMLARLVMNPAALGEDFTLGLNEGHTWGDVAQYYAEALGAQFCWVPAKDYVEVVAGGHYMGMCILMYDRMYNRSVDNGKVLRATGLTDADFVSTRDAIIAELSFLSSRKDLLDRFDTPWARELDRRMDDYLSSHNL